MFQILITTEGGFFYIFNARRTNKYLSWFPTRIIFQCLHVFTVKYTINCRVIRV